MMRLKSKVALFWDESYLWGIIAYRTFSALGIDFDLLSAAEIRGGALDPDGHDLIFVPGGWARDKMAALGEGGGDAIRDFVRRGGGYLGFCGGAGLALSHDSGLGLAPFGRVPTRERLPSFSGRISLRHDTPGHAMWREIDSDAAFHAWWPGQFEIDADSGARILASYGQPEPGSFVTDLPCDQGLDWKLWESCYGINLDPARIAGHPAVVEVDFGHGRAILSYLHFETPGDTCGHQVLLNLIEGLGGKPATGGSGMSVGDAGVQAIGRPEAQLTVEMKNAARTFIDFGVSNFMWYWRSDWLLQWRRGVRGIEYSTLYGMLSEIDRLMPLLPVSDDAGLLNKLAVLHRSVSEFLTLARELVLKERYAMSFGPVSPLKSDDAEILRLRGQLFSTKRRCGGLYREIMDQADGILLPLLRREMKEMGRGP